MAFLRSLEIGKRALLANQLALDVTANNVANVNTPGYSQRRIELTETSPELTTAGLLGTGVSATRILRIHNQYIEQNIRATTAQKFASEHSFSIIRQIESFLGIDSETSIVTYIQNFFDALHFLANQPESLQRRSAVVSAAQSLTETFHSLGKKLTQLRFDLKDKATNITTTVNSLLEQIAKLNEKIRAASAHITQNTAAYEDRRSALLDELSRYLDISVHIDEQNLTHIAVNGTSILFGTNYHTLRVQETIDSTTEERTLQIFLENRTGTPIIPIEPTAGELGSVLHLYNVLLDDKDTSGKFSLTSELNRFVESFVAQFNAVSTNGYGLDDNGALPGRNFFDPDGTTIFTIAVSDEIQNDPRAIPTSSTPGTPGNNDIALQLANLINKEDFLNGTTMTDYLSQIMTQLSIQGQNAQRNIDASSALEAQLISQKEAISGVNLDEEAVNLIKYQKAYEAAARIFTISNELLETLINLGR